MRMENRNYLIGNNLHIVKQIELGDFLSKNCMPVCLAMIVIGCKKYKPLNEFINSCT